MNYQEVQQLVNSKGHVFFDSGKYNLNFVWLRNDLSATNHFTDPLFIAYRDSDGVGQVLNIKCTTKPGLRGSLLNPVTVEGVTGTAVIKEGQYKGAWKFIDSYEGFSKYPYFAQIKPIDYYRDGNKDGVIDKVHEQKARIYGTHWHRMSNVGDKRKIEDFEVNNWSLGCMGAPIAEWDKVIALTRLAIKSGQAPIFTGTIISNI